MFSIFWCYLHFFVFVQNWNFKNFKGTRTLCEKCPNNEKFLVRIFLYLDLVWTDTPYLSVFSVGMRGTRVRMLGKWGMLEIRVGMRGIRVVMWRNKAGMRGIGVGMLETRVRMLGIRVGIRGISVRIRGIRLEMQGIWVGMLGIMVGMQGVWVGMQGIMLIICEKI